MTYHAKAASMSLAHDLSNILHSPLSTSTRLLLQISNTQAHSLSISISSPTKSHLSSEHQRHLQRGFTTGSRHFNTVTLCTNICQELSIRRDEMFTLHFDTNHSIDPIQVALHKYDSSSSSFVLTEAAKRYKKSYTKHPTDPVRPISLLVCRATLKYRATRLPCLKPQPWNRFRRPAGLI